MPGPSAPAPSEFPRPGEHFDKTLFLAEAVQSETCYTLVPQAGLALYRLPPSIHTLTHRVEQHHLQPDLHDLF